MYGRLVGIGRFVYREPYISSEHHCSGTVFGSFTAAAREVDPAALCII